MNKQCTLLPALAAAAAIAVPTLAFADDAPYVQAEAGASFLSEWSNGEARPGTAAYGVSAGYHWDQVELGLMVQQTYWLSDAIDPESTFPNSVLNIAAEGALTSFGDRGRHAIAIGTSTLLFDTNAAAAGHTGLYLEAIPLGLRLPLGSAGWRLEFEPLNFALMAPVLDGIPLFQVAYRTTLGVGYEF